jgi:hypothetical protein
LSSDSPTDVEVRHHFGRVVLEGRQALAASSSHQELSARSPVSSLLTDPACYGVPPRRRHEVDLVFAGAGTTARLMGDARQFKRTTPVRIVAVER